ncbi:MAG: hypothetical protein D6785_01815 [Planctomycetota bacterium]|nr:MAG: hypothetical protein D6785_01815 [Planctomycetota bacterium]
MKLYKTHKKVLHFIDPGLEFHKNYTANTLDRTKNVFSDIKGKVVATFDQLPIADNEYFVILEECRLEPLMEHLSKYLPLCRVEIKEMDTKVYFDLEDFKSQQPEEDKKEKMKGFWRIPQKAGSLVLCDQDLEATVSEEEFIRFRLIHEIPLEGVDFQQEMVLNIHPTEYVSFTKGCFLGQEVLSRVHFKSKPPRKLVVMPKSKLEKSLQEEMTSLAYLPEKEDWYGFVFLSNKDLE